MVGMVTRQSSPAAQKKYMKKYTMPWLAVANESAEAKALSKHYNIKGIPALSIIAPNGHTFTESGAEDVMRHKKKALERWQNQFSSGN